MLKDKSESVKVVMRCRPLTPKEMEDQRECIVNVDMDIGSIQVYNPQNIKELKKHLPNTLVGVGDNDLHYLSESRCCCGIDTINENFDNYLRYNLTYFTTEHLGKKIDEDEKIWIPKCNCANFVNGDLRIKGVGGFKDYVDSYCSKFNDFMCDGCSMKNKMQGISYAKSTGKKQQQITIFNIDEIQGDNNEQ